MVNVLHLDSKYFAHNPTILANFINENNRGLKVYLRRIEMLAGFGERALVITISLPRN